MESSIPNLDNMYAFELDRSIRTFQALAEYCHLRKDAELSRLTGMIARAQMLEQKMDEIFNALPDWARW